MKKILVVCAHPDDETLGMGGTIALHTKRRDKVYVLILSEGETARGKKSSNIFFDGMSKIFKSSDEIFTLSLRIY